MSLAKYMCVFASHDPAATPDEIACDRVVYKEGGVKMLVPDGEFFKPYLSFKQLSVIDLEKVREKEAAEKADISKEEADAALGRT